MARENITTQLMQLEGASLDPYSLGGAPDSRNVYAELQKELREIDDLLGTDAGRQDGGSLDAAELAYQPMATLAAPQAQWMWRFRGVAVGNVALLVIGWATIFALRDDRASSLSAGGCFVAICLASVWAATRTRERELRLFLFTVAIGTALVGAVVLLAGLTT